MPKFVIHVGGRDYVVASKEGVGALTELMAEAMPVTTHLYDSPPTIELDWTDKPDIIEHLQEVSCRRIPANVVWKQKTQKGEVVEVRPVAKAPKVLKAPPRKALRGPERIALPAPSPQLALL